MIDHILILESRVGSSDVISSALAGWDAEGKPGVISLAVMAWEQPRRDCHALFELAAEKLSAFMAERKVRPAISRAVVVMDWADFTRLNPLKAVGHYHRDYGSNPILALLILSFPEVLWGFAHHVEGTDIEPAANRDAHSLDAWLAHGEPPAIDPLLDPSGLRDSVRKQASDYMKAQFKGSSDLLPFRNQWGVAMDDESAYAFFNAYTLYRHGFRAAPICSWASATYFLLEKSITPPMVSVEDLYMSFADVPSSKGDVHLSDLDKRDIEFPLLKRIKFRVILTSGHTTKHSDHVSLQIQKRKAERLLKPIGGMFSMWQKSGLREKMRDRDRQRKRWVGGYAPGYYPGVPIAPELEGVGHSAPGALLAAAERLLQRADTMKHGISRVEDAVLGAVLATDAFELLASRTPTRSLDALVLKHELEVRAECCFMGVQNHFDVRSRLRMVQNALRLLSKWYDEGQQDVARWNGEAVVVGRVMEVFRAHQQFDEEQLYIARARTLHRRLWFRQHFGRLAGTTLRCFNPFYWLAWYVGLLLKSVPTFLFVFMLWIAVITVGFHNVENSLQGSEKPAKEAAAPKAGGDTGVSVYNSGPWVRALGDAFSCMVSVGSPLHTEVLNSGSKVPFAYLLSCLGMGLGFLHIGIFISHLYSIISRK